jgi:hypothetical protein
MIKLNYHTHSKNFVNLFLSSCVQYVSLRPRRANGQKWIVFHTMKKIRTALDSSFYIRAIIENASNFNFIIQ